MYISKIMIQNFRNFREFNVELKQYAVIVGANKAGKSNLLQAIRLAIDPNLRHKDRILDQSDFWDGEVVEDEERIVTIVVEISLVNEDEVNLLTNIGAISSQNTARLMYRYPTTLPLELKFDVNNIDDGSIQIGESVEPSSVSSSSYIWVAGPEGKEVEVTSNKLARCLSFEAMNALRDTEGLLGSWSRTPLKPLLQSLSITPERLSEIANDVQTQASQLRKEDTVDQLVNRINKRSTDMVGDIFSTTSDLNILTGEAEDLLKAMRLLVDNKRPIDRTSLGTQNILYLSLLLEELSIRNPSIDGLNQQLILALEEPEAHIHPHVQRSIFRYFNEQIQLIRSLIVTTHSPHIASVAPLKSIVVMRDEGKKNGSKAYWLRGDLADQDATDIQRFLDVTRAELIFARGIIFVEGTSEKYLIPAFAKAIGCDLDHLGISVVSVESTNFLPYAKLVASTNLNIPYTILTDLDSQNSEGLSGVARMTALCAKLYGSSLTTQAEFETRNIFIGQSTLELEIIPTCEVAMLEVYEQFGKGTGAMSSFKTNLEMAITGNATSIKFVLDRIKEISKVRFAQRLAPIVEGNSDYCPPYIKRCIESIVSLLR